jgi:ATP/maltotriose-dependent transcriptional regulator MalT
MMKAKLVLGVAAGVVVALLAGWIWGASGRSDTARALRSSELRGELLAARAAVLDARVAIYSTNFGEAGRHLDDARGLLGRANDRLKSLGLNDEVTQVQMAQASIDEAQRMAGRLDQVANARAGEAAKTLAAVVDAEAKR